MDENQVASQVLDICFEMHRMYGPGLLESVYEEIFAFELSERGIPFQRQKAIPLVHKTRRLDMGFRADIIVMDKVLVEFKSVECLNPVHAKQVLTYLKLTGLKLGLLINFNENLLKDGVRRIINGYI
jgi:GxxExxY protein